MCEVPSSKLIGRSNRACPGTPTTVVAVCRCTAKNGKYCSLQIANYWHRFIIKGTYESRCKGRTACCVSARPDLRHLVIGNCRGWHLLLPELRAAIPRRS